MQHIFTARRVGTAVVAIVLAVLVIPPIVGTIYGSFWSQSAIIPGGHLTLMNWPTVLLGKSFLTSLLTTLELTVISAPIATVIGTLLAFVVARTNVRGRRLIDVCMRLNLMLTPFILSIAWLGLGTKGAGLLNYVPAALGLPPIFDIQSIGGISFVMVTYLVPWIYTALKPAISSTDTRLEDAADVFGAGRARILSSVTFPLLRPVIASSAILVAVLGLEMFSIPAVLGAPKGIDTLSYVMYTNIQTAPAAWQNAAVIGSFLLITCFLGIALQRRVVGSVQRYQSVGISPPPIPMRLGRLRWLFSLFAIGYVAIVTLLPLASLIFSSFVKYSSGLQFSSSMFTLDVWQGILADPNFYLALKNSLIVMIVGAVLCVLITFLAAVIIYWIRPARVTAAIEYVVRLPIAIPGVVLGAGLLWVYFKVPLPIYGTLAIIVIGVLAKSLPPAFNLIAGRYTQVPNALREASLVSGASRFGAVRDVDVKLMRGALVGAAVLSTIIIVGEVNVSIMVYQPDTITLPVYLWQVINGSQNYQFVYGIAILQTLITSLLLIALAWFGRTRRRRAPASSSVLPEPLSSTMPEPVGALS
jgi:iron(III) transport system permease protein